MHNDVDATTGAETPEKVATRPAPLVILASDEDAVCVDDLCLPADTRQLPDAAAASGAKPEDRAE